MKNFVKRSNFDLDSLRLIRSKLNEPRFRDPETNCFKLTRFQIEWNWRCIGNEWSSKSKSSSSSRGRTKNEYYEINFWTWLIELKASFVYINICASWCLRLNGLGVWFSLWVREVPGSNPGWAQLLFKSLFWSLKLRQLLSWVEILNYSRFQTLN